MEPEHSSTSRPATAHQSAQDYASYLGRKRLVLVALAAILVVLVIVSVMTGSAGLSLGQVIAALFGQGDDYAKTIVWSIRMPHILAALIGGVALSLAGCVFQSVLRNPLASASTLGISQGAAFGASLAIIVLGGASAAGHDGVTFSNPYITVLLAFVGAVASTAIILALSSFREMTPESIVLCGVALSALFSGGTAMIQYFAEDTQVAAVVFWTFGDLRRVSYRELAIMAGMTGAAAVFFFINRWNYNAMESGESSAHGLGVNVRGVRLAGMLVASAAAASIIAFCGTINFIGLVAPHIVRRLIGSDYRYLLPASALAGASLLLLADLVASVVVPGVILPISAITSFIGAPLFLYLLMRGMHR